MKNFVIKTLVTISGVMLLLLLGGVVVSWFVERNNFENWETESNLLLIEEDEKYDLLFLGMSHCRNFARYSNQVRMEEVLNKEILNLGKGAAKSGVYNQYLYLKYFYNRRNNVKKVVYVLTPILLFSTYLDHASNTYEEEPFNLEFLKFLMDSDSPNKYQQAFYYHRSKFRAAWILHKPRSLPSMDDTLAVYSPQMVEKIFELAYLDGFEQEQILRNTAILEKTIQLAKENNSEITFFVPPALFGKWKGHDETIRFLQRMKTKYGISFEDFSEKVAEKKYYYDHHHLNSLGVDFFVKNYLKSFL